MSIFGILKELGATSSRLEKEAILKREKDNHLLIVVFQRAYDPYINYYQKKIPPINGTGILTLEQGIANLDALITRQVTGNAAIDHLQKILNSLQSEDQTVLSRIIERDLDCGVGIPTINKIWPGAIPTFDVMLSHKDCSGIKFPAYVQDKKDGGRVHVYRSGNTIRAFSRNGKELLLHGVLDHEGMYLMKEGDVWDGEIVFAKDGTPLDRKTSNGLFNKCVKNTIAKEEAEDLVFHCWDIVDFTSTIPYKTRLSALESAMMNLPSTKRFSLLKTTTVNSMDEVEALFAEALSRGEEGVMAKNIDAVWEPKRTKNLGKVKAEEEADLLVVGIVPGTGKYEGMLGAVVCQTSDGLLEVNVGTGFSDEERSRDPSWINGKIISVMYNQKITSKGKTTASLFLPRFQFVRHDKNVANTLGELK